MHKLGKDAILSHQIVSKKMIDSSSEEKEILKLSLRTVKDRRRGLLCNGAILELGLGLKAMIGVCPDFEDDNSTQNEELETKLDENVQAFSLDANTAKRRDGRRVMLDEVMRKHVVGEKRKRGSSMCSKICKRIVDFVMGPKQD